ncbi:MAG: VCBS repeat-containing protein [Gammaproteobacteria bacterium]|nr:VCBS repeat-containing protein [Gammaproteobacteria bacterium]
MKNVLNRREGVPVLPALLSTLLAAVLKSPIRIFQLLLLLATVVFYFIAEAGTTSAEQPITHGQVAVHDGPGVQRAWYACPTERYPHGVLGDTIEGGCLMARSADGTLLEIQLDDSAVFEDTTPRLADMDGDGQTDIVTVRSGASVGAALVIYGLSDGELKEIAATPAIGTANRWLAPAGIADFDGDGTIDIAYVETPHLGGLLRIWSMVDGTFSEIASMRGFSNHSIGESRVSLSRLLDYNKDGITDLALPTFGRGYIAIVSMVPTLDVIATQAFDHSFFN